jgi:hypothetical protein
MAETGEGIGDLLTGGIIAREVERASRAAGHGPSEGAGGKCLNCGAVRTGPFCQNCGQSGHSHRNVSALAHDILHGVFHFEGKIWKTLPMLAFHPGDLTRRYVHGERAKFVSPMALFLFSVFLLFAAVNRLSSPDMAGAAQGLAKAQVQLGTASANTQENLDRLEKKRIDTLAADPKADLGDLNQKITDAQREVAGLSVAAQNLPAAKPSRPAREAAGAMDIDTGLGGLDRQIAHVKDNPALYAYKLKMASYKFSWALIPISVPFIWLMFFWRRDVGLYDHAIFAIHSLSFMTLFTVALLGLYFVGVPQAPLWCAVLLVPPVHMYKQLKNAYRIGRFGAAWRTVTLLSMTGVTSLLFFLLLLWLEAE